MKPPSLSLWSAWWEGGFGTETKEALSTTRWHWIAFPESWPPKTFQPVLLIPLKVLLSNMSAPQNLPFICWGSYKILTDFGSLFRPIRCLARGQQALQGSAVVTGAVHQRLGDELPASGAPGLSRKTGQMVRMKSGGPWDAGGQITTSLSPQGTYTVLDTWQSLDTFIYLFICHNWRGDATGLQWVQVWDAAEHAYSAQDSRLPRNK